MLAFPLLVTLFPAAEAAAGSCGGDCRLRREAGSATALGVGSVSASNQLQRGRVANQPVQGVAVGTATAGAPTVGAVAGGDGGLDDIAVTVAVAVTVVAAVTGLDFGGDESFILVVAGLSSEPGNVVAGSRL